jgi:hypothetical protein
MRQLNARLTVVVAAVAVAAVVGGGVFAYRQGPRDSDTGASPLGGPPSATPAPTPTPTRTPAKPSATPSLTPAATPTVTPTGPRVTGEELTGPDKVAVTLAKLSEGRAPQLVHVIGREVAGGPGQAAKVPGKGRIIRAARAGETTFVIESREPDYVLVRIEVGGETREVRDVNTLAGSTDNTGVAYATRKETEGGADLKGSTVYADDGNNQQKLSLPDAWETKVIAFAAGKVFYSAKTSRTAPAKLYSWSPGRSSATVVKGVTDPTAVSADGKVAASIEAWSDSGTCSFVVEVSSGKTLWRTCEYMVMGFSPDKSVVIAGPAYGDGYAPMGSWALDGKTGKVLREWNGVAFREVRAEDDQHLLMEVDDGPETKGAIIRCTISTGDCERATPITPGDEFGLGG